MLKSKLFKEVQNDVLKAFQEEIPSIYYSDKSEKEFLNWKKTMDYMYHDRMNFPPKMFNNQKLLDFGAGTGENTVYFENWGAKCTLVEMNNKAHEISKDIFAKYANDIYEHTFVLSSIFDYESAEKYDIVHSRGVFAHTNDPQVAFSKLASFLKPGGYLIYGDGNKSGNFQNMLQRMIIFRFADNWDDMVEVAETLFKEDLDRAQQFANRTRRCIIFDKWVVPRLTNPSVSEVLNWFADNNIKLYSSYPPIIPAVLSDSLHHKPKFYPQHNFDIGAFTESLWMIYNREDSQEVPKILETFRNLSTAQYALTDYIDDYNLDTVTNLDTFNNKIDKYQESLTALDLTSHLKKRSSVFLEEVKSILDLIEKGNLDNLKNYIDQATELFRGGNGVRHIDFIGYKVEEELK